MNIVKKIFRSICSILIPISLITVVIANLIVSKHIAFTNICYIVLLSSVIVNKLLKYKEPIGIPKSIFISMIGIFVVLSFGLCISEGIENFATWSYWKRYTTIPLIAFIFLLLPKQKAFTYISMLAAFAIALIAINTVTFYNYFLLIVINNGRELPSQDWANFMDLMRPYILPLDYFHHTLAIFNIFGLAILYLLYKNFRAKKWLFIVPSLLLIFFIHFLSSRLAITALYLIGFIYLIASLKKVKHGILIIFVSSIFMLMTLLLLSQTVPTLKLKTDKLVNELRFYKNSTYEQILNGPDYRLRSYFAGFKVIKENWLVGIGIPNVGKTFKGTTWPLNNYLYFSVIFGVPIAIVLLLLHFYPIVYIDFKNNFGMLMLTFYLLHFLYSFTDVGYMLRDYFYFFTFWSACNQHINLHWKLTDK